MEIKHAQVIKPNDKVFVRVWETARPYQQDYRAHMDFKIAESKWEQSYKEFPVMEKDLDKFIFLAEDSAGKIRNYQDAVTFTNSLSIGINIPNDRIGFEYDCQTGRQENNKHKCCIIEHPFTLCYCKQHATLIEVKEEGEDENKMWLELEQLFYSHADSMEAAKQKFTIKRK